MGMNKYTKKTIEKLILYRKITRHLIRDGVEKVYSHKLASLVEDTPDQVRRNLMGLGYFGSPAHGYDTQKLNESISNFLDAPNGQQVAIIGLGKLGRAILDYCKNKNPKIFIIAAFDNDPLKINKIVNDCFCFDITLLEKKIAEMQIDVAILTTPTVADSQSIAQRLVSSGIKGIVNFTRAHLMVDPNIYVENMDMMLSLEKVCFFARNGKISKEEN